MMTGDHLLPCAVGKRTYINLFHPMLTQDMQELAKAKAHVAELEATIASELKEALAELPTQYGFSSVEEFVQAVKDAATGGGSTRSAGPASRGGKTGSRARITDETRAELKRMVKRGMTGAQIAKTLGISLPSVQNIKKAFGLVKSRS